MLECIKTFSHARRDNVCTFVPLFTNCPWRSKLKRHTQRGKSIALRVTKGAWNTHYRTREGEMHVIFRYMQFSLQLRTCILARDNCARHTRCSARLCRKGLRAIRQIAEIIYNENTRYLSARVFRSYICVYAIAKTSLTVWLWKARFIEISTA